MADDEAFQHEPLAYHEAGHVVIAHAVGNDVEAVLAWLDPSGVVAHALTSTKWTWMWMRADCAEAEAEMFTTMAGDAAETIKFGTPSWPEPEENKLYGQLRETMGDDWLAGDGQQWLGALRARVVSMLQERWPAVEAVASELLTRGFIPGSQARSLVQRSLAGATLGVVVPRPTAKMTVQLSEQERKRKSALVWHEAGHVVVRYVQGYDITCAHIAPTLGERSGTLTGRMSAKRRRIPGGPDELDDLVVSLAAGTYAEWMASGESLVEANRADSAIMEVAVVRRFGQEWFADDGQHHWDKVGWRAHDILRSYWPAVSAVARILETDLVRSGADLVRAIQPTLSRRYQLPCSACRATNCPQRE